ncbi:MAG: hypothetical protein ACK2TX_10160, partial [Anaerolineales bacterium]
ELAEQIAAHREYLDESGERQLRELSRARKHLQQELMFELWNGLLARVGEEQFTELVNAVVERRLSPRAAIERMMSEMET